MHPSIDGCVKTRYGARHPSGKTRDDSSRAVCRRIPRRIERAGASPQVHRRGGQNHLYAGSLSGEHEAGIDFTRRHSGSRRSTRRQRRERRGGQERSAQDCGRAGAGVPQAPAGSGEGGEGIRAEVGGSTAQGRELPQRPGAPHAIRDRGSPVAHQRAGRALLSRGRADRAGKGARAATSPSPATDPHSFARFFPARIRLTSFGSTCSGR